MFSFSLMFNELIFVKLLNSCSPFNSIVNFELLSLSKFKISKTIGFLSTSKRVLNAKIFFFF